MPTPPTSPDPLISRTDLCARLGVHPDTIRRMERSGRLIGYHLGHRTARYRAEDVQRLLDAARHSQRRKPGPKPKATPQALLPTT